ncbi:hypothetical protein BN59_01110 [Legionella massiliensis]|uniref:Uncharacterized protein n=1 Tax=Legionella massiliensis TaxID=1034943 RepID=A0A078KYH8_9GAMM|nr:hypothetical protein [Legionella massiliensis]CDZ76834.1 hypothetical protein BN59_01110 [Legionella massiliensis]CEE12572.1 hypothetical protein BN1094_01110 [Legionella massiliensis]
MPYKNFSDFKNIELKFGNIDEGLNYGYTATANFSSIENSLFDDEFFLLFRRSEYAAQVELACAKIFKQLMGYGLEMELVQEGEQFFIASRKIRNFTEGCEDVKDQSPSTIQGLISVFIIWYFIGQTDTHSGNFGLANSAGIRLAFGLDMAEALDFEMLSQPLTLLALKQIPYIVEEHYHGVCEDTLPPSFVTSEPFQQEKLAITKKIAETPFEIFETIIRETITSNFSIHQRIMLEKTLQSIDDASIKEELLANFEQENFKDYSIDALIQVLKTRHKNWKLLFQENPEENFSQDYSLSAHSIFFEALDQFHGGASDSSENGAEEHLNSLTEYSNHLFWASEPKEVGPNSASLQYSSNPGYNSL